MAQAKRTKVDKTLAYLTSEVKDLEKGEADLVQKLADMRASLAHARLRLAEYKDINKNAFTYYFPAEIMVAIFKIVATYRDEQSLNYRMPITVSHVSRRWRNIALQTPLLWSTIFMDTEASLRRIFDTYIERSRSCLLDIEMGPEWMMNYHFFVSKILPHINRWRQLTVNFYSNRALSILIKQLADLKAPCLESIILHAEQDNTPDDDTDVAVFSDGAPLLSSVRLTGLVLRSCTPPLAHLTTLDLGWAPRPMAHESFRRVVDAAPSLKDLSLDRLAVAFNRIQPIPIPSLRTLTLGHDWNTDPDDWSDTEISGPFIGLRMPALHSLEFLHLGLGDMEDVITVWSKSPACRDFPALHFLDVSSSDIPDGRAIDFITFLPTVVHVSLPGALRGSLLHPLAHSVHNDTPLWPKLDTIEINKAYCEEAFLLLRAVVQNRIDKGEPIAVVKLSSSSTMSEDAAAWLRRHVSLK